MRRIYRLGLRRSLLSEVDREEYDAEDGEKLTLPVLERLEPESAVAQVLKYPFSRQMLHGQLLILIEKTTIEVKDER